MCQYVHVELALSLPLKGGYCKIYVQRVDFEGTVECFRQLVVCTLDGTSRVILIKCTSSLPTFKLCVSKKNQLIIRSWRSCTFMCMHAAVHASLKFQSSKLRDDRVQLCVPHTWNGGVMGRQIFKYELAEYMNTNNIPACRISDKNIWIVDEVPGFVYIHISRFQDIYLHIWRWGGVGCK